ncbi:bZIP transcription factor [Agathobaculum sp. Marseille-P7918]|uniref:bZIP transcription factor n=1 Tax=Agathobaculum sp. Marseille-P7918 TaxID=2479843 RepID=UPI00356231E7
MERTPARRRSSAKPMKLNYRMLLCIAVLVFFLLALLFFILFLSRGGKIDELNKQVETLNGEKTSLSEQVNTLTQDNQTMLAGLTAALPDPTTAQTDDLTALIPQLTEGVYVVRSTGTQYQYLSVPTGYLQDKLTAYRDNAEGYSVVEGDAPACTCWVLFPDRVIGLAEGDKGFVSMDRAATGSATTVPSGMYAFVASFFA